jgi:SSS family transporter
MASPVSALTTIDWLIVAAYLGAVIAIGVVASRSCKDTGGFFLAGRTMPSWAVSLSVLATSLSAATFISVPELAYRGNLSYLILNIGAVIGVVIVSLAFIPPLYRAGTLTIYGYLGKRYGQSAMVAASLVFLVGRLLASGARLFIAAIAISLVIYGDTSTPHLVGAVLLFGTIGTAYTLFGGIRAVIWTDVMQIIIVVGAALLSIYLLLDAIPLAGRDIVSALIEAPGGSKLKIVDWRLGPTLSFTVWTGLIASAFVSASAYSVDHDMVQRLLTARSAQAGGRALIGSVLLGIPVVGLFLIIGLLLYIYYGRPDLMLGAGPLDTIDDTRRVYPQFLLNHLPVGLRGLTMAGIIAAAMSSLDSAVNALASSAVGDIYGPLRNRFRHLGNTDKSSTDAGLVSLRISRLAVALTGILLTAFGVLAVHLQSRGNETVIGFALGIMAFANAPLFGVFSAAILTARGNSTSAIASLLAGSLTVLLLQPYMLPSVIPELRFAWPWWWVIAAPISFAICIMGRPERRDLMDTIAPLPD